MELQDGRRYRELEKENRELTTMLADSQLKIRMLEEVNSKVVSPQHKRRSVAAVVSRGLGGEKVGEVIANAEDPRDGGNRCRKVSRGGGKAGASGRKISPGIWKRSLVGNRRELREGKGPGIGENLGGRKRMLSIGGLTTWVYLAVGATGMRKGFGTPRKAERVQRVKFPLRKGGEPLHLESSLGLMEVTAVACASSRSLMNTAGSA